MGKNLFENRSILVERSDGDIINVQHCKVLKDDETMPVLTIFMHGFPKYQNGKSNFFGLLSETLVDSGFSTLQFDYVNTESSTEQTYRFSLESAKKDTEALFEWARQEGYQHIGFIAEGLGSLILFESLPEEARFSVLCWPVLDLDRLCSDFKIDQQLSKLKECGYIEHGDVQIGLDFIKEIKNKDTESILKSVHTPTLILHGEQDAVVSPDHLEIARQHLMAPRLDITTFEDGQHGLEQAHHRKACLHLIKEFTTRYTKNLKTVLVEDKSKIKETA